MGRRGNYMRVFAGLGFSLLLTLVVFGQNGATVTGRVVMPNNGGGVHRSDVTLKSKSDSSLVYKTDADGEGNFTFRSVQAGEYVITAGPGISSVDMYVEQAFAVKEGDTLDLTLTVKLVGVMIRESVTISVNSNQPIEEVSKTVSVISGQEMRDRADFTLIDSLRTIPGFSVQQLGGFGRTASIKSRGLRSQDTALLVDGIRFRDPSAITGDASPFLGDITLTSVSRVEVLRGPGSSLYGTNAIGGTVDFRTPQATSGTHGQVSGAFGGMGLGRFRGNISHGLANGKFGIGAALSRTAYTKGIDGQDNAGNTNFQTRADLSPSAKTSISGRIFLSDAKVRLNASPDTFGIMPATNSLVIRASPNVNFVGDAYDPDSFQGSRAFTGQFVVNQVINDKLYLSGHYQGLATRRTNDNGALGPGFQGASTSIFDGQIHTGNVHLNWTPTKLNSLTAGYEFERESFGNEGRTPSGTEDFYTSAGQVSHTAYVQDMLRLLDGTLQFAGGARLQKFGLSRPSFSLANAPYSDPNLVDPPNAFTLDGSASYYVRRTGTKIRAHIGNGYRVPSLYERFGTFYSTFGTPSFIAIGDPYLKPEKTLAVDGGIEQDFARRRVVLSAVYFYTTLDETIGYGNVVPNIGTTTRPYGGYLNQKGGIARGAELSGTLKPWKGADIFTSYTFTNSDQRSPQVAGSGVISSLGIPEHQFTLVATQRYKRFWVNFDLVAGSSYLAPIFSNSTYSTYVYRFSGNRKGDLTSGYTIRASGEKVSVRIFGTIENIFGREYYENGFRTASRTARIGTSLSF